MNNHEQEQTVYVAPLLFFYMDVFSIKSPSEFDMPLCKETKLIYNEQNNLVGQLKNWPLSYHPY